LKTELRIVTTATI